MCVFIPVLNVPFRTLTLNNPSLYATTNPDVWLRLSPLLYSLTEHQLGQKARDEQRDYRCRSHCGRQTVTPSKRILLPLKAGVLSYSNEATSAQSQRLDEIRRGYLPAVMGDVAANHVARSVIKSGVYTWVSVISLTLLRFNRGHKWWQHSRGVGAGWLNGYPFLKIERLQIVIRAHVSC